MTAVKTKPPEPEKAPEPPAPEPLLDLSTIAPTRQTVRLRTKANPDGKLYELRLLIDFGIGEQQGLMRDGGEFDRLWNKTENLTNNERKRLEMLLNRMFDKVLVAPQAVKDQMSDSLKSQVVTAFTFAPLTTVAEAEMATEDSSDSQTEPDETQDDPSTTES